MKQYIRIEDADRMLNDFHMPADLAQAIDGMVHRIMELSDNDILFDEADVVKGYERRQERRGILDQGSYSTGTLRDSDMLSMFSVIAGMTRCETCKQKQHLAWTYGQAGYQHEQQCEDSTCHLQDDARDMRSAIIEELFDHVNDDHTPEDHYFGSNDGDGADFGVWQIGEDG